VGDAQSLPDPHEVLAGNGDIDGAIENDSGVFINDGGDLDTGYSSKLHMSSPNQFEFPNGTYWLSNKVRIK